VACREFPTLGFQVGEWIEAQLRDPRRRPRRRAVPADRRDVAVPAAPLPRRPARRARPAHGRWRLPFVYVRGSQLVRPQKWGKGPFASAIICAEAAPDGPVLFDGWDADGQPVGRPWATPHIQVTAASEDQADNVWGALLPMIERGASPATSPTRA
jgi:hypothetical protein